MARKRIAVREGLIRESAKRAMKNASRKIANDVLEDGGSLTDARKYMMRLIIKATKNMK
jgi:hypothetical protein